MTEDSQHMKALERANEVRLQRADLKKSIGRGDTAVATVLTELPWEAETMGISELLCAQRRWGKTRARKFLQPHNIYENKEVGSMTLRQRKLLANSLQERESGSGN